MKILSKEHSQCFINVLWNKHDKDFFKSKIRVCVKSWTNGLIGTFLIFLQLPCHQIFLGFDISYISILQFSYWYMCILWKSICMKKEYSFIKGFTSFCLLWKSTDWQKICERNKNFSYNWQLDITTSQYFLTKKYTQTPFYIVLV